MDGSKEYWENDDNNDTGIQHPNIYTFLMFSLLIVSF